MICATVTVLQSEAVVGIGAVIVCVSFCHDDRSVSASDAPKTAGVEGGATEGVTVGWEYCTQVGGR